MIKMIALTLTAFFFLVALGIRTIAQVTTPPRPDVFLDYSDYLPGASGRDLPYCHTYYIEYRFIYSDCKMPVGSPFRYIWSSSISGQINYAYMSIQNDSIRLPDLLAWKGKYKRFTHGKKVAFIMWADGTVASIYHWGNSMNAVIDHISFRRETSDNAPF